MDKKCYNKLENKYRLLRYIPNQKDLDIVDLFTEPVYKEIIKNKYNIQPYLYKEVLYKPYFFWSFLWAFLKIMKKYIPIAIITGIWKWKVEIIVGIIIGVILLLIEYKFFI